MKAPMVPRPMNPIFMSSALRLVLFVEHIGRGTGGGHRRRPTGMDRTMGDELCGHRAGWAVAAADMAARLVLPARRGNGDQAAVAPGQRRAFPESAAAIAVRHFRAHRDMRFGA